MDGLLPLEAIEVLRKASAMCLEEMSLDNEHKQGIELIERVKDAEEIPGMLMGSDGQEIS
jgi:hypothetical protein